MSVWTPELGQRIAARARAYVGVKYHHCGRNEHGLDCAGLVVRVAHDLGLTDWDEVDYSQHVSAHYMRRSLSRFCDEAPLLNGEPLPGDLLWFTVEGNPQHIAVYYGGPHRLMIHACNSRGRVIEHRLAREWLDRMVTIWRWRGDIGDDRTAQTCRDKFKSLDPFRPGEASQWQP